MKFHYYGRHKDTALQTCEDILAGKYPVIAVDVETVSLEILDVIGIGIAISPEDSFFFPLQPDISEYFGRVIQLLSDPGITKIFHNFMFDCAAMAQFKIDTSNVVDTMIMARLLGELEANLPYLAACHFFELPQLPRIKEWIWELTIEQIALKCCTDCEATWVIYQDYKDKVDMEYLKVEMQLIPILVAMSSKGLLIDQDIRGMIDAELAQDIQLFLDSAEELNFNPGSPKQVAYMLSKDKVFLPMTRSRKSLSTAKEMLNKINHPLAGFVLAYRQQQKLYSTYIHPLANEERCSTKFHLDAITGRISSSKHNMQNIPKGRMRNIFLPDTGIFTDIDWSQIELRVLAHISGDEAMQAVLGLPDGDIHQASADLMGIPRGIAKSSNFAMLYGATAETIMETAHISDRKKALELKTLWGMAYPQAMDWIEAQQAMGLKAGHIYTLYNRMIPLPMHEKESRLKRMAVNYPIQGSAAEIVKRAMITIADSGLLDRMRLQVHDELLFEGDVSKELAELNLTDIAPFHTPYKLALLNRWE